MRINARLEPASALQLEYLVTHLGLSASDVLRKGVDLLYKQQAAQTAQPLHFFGKHVGKYRSGKSDLSVSYKQELATLLDDKFPPAGSSDANPKGDAKRKPAKHQA